MHPLLILLVFVVCCAQALATPFKPDSDSEVLEVLPRSLGEADAGLSELQKQLAADPRNADLAAELAARYIELARSESDPRYAGYAQAALGPWWGLDRPPARMLLLRATLRQHRHEFAQAIDDLEALVKLAPRDSQAWLTLATIYQVRGEYTKAKAACSVLARTAPLELATVCHSAVMSVTGQAERAYRLLTGLAPRIRNSTPGMRQWLTTLMAETAWRLGKTDHAESHFTDALTVGRRDPYLLGVYADFLLAEQRPHEALALLADEARDDSLLLRLAIVAKRAGAQQTAREHRELLSLRFTEAQLRGDQRHLRERAWHALEFNGDPQQALELARRNWQEQKEPLDAWLYMRAARDAREDVTVRAAQDWITQWGLQDPNIAALTSRQERG
ncbi:MAG: tetratricopeptide repeat protein [Gammaproteobacteria bacterium]